MAHDVSGSNNPSPIETGQKNNQIIFKVYEITVHCLRKQDRILIKSPPKFPIILGEK